MPMRGTRAIVVAVLLLPMFQVLDTPVAGQSANSTQEPTIVFKSSVEMVGVNAVVRDRRGRLVRDLTKADFEVIDGGVTRSILEFRDDFSAVSVAMLFDVSGSMEGRMPHAREAASHLLGWLDDSSDEVAVLTFDTGLDEVTPFTPGLRELPSTLGALTPFGATSLHDAIAATAKLFDERGASRRAVIVFTDGDDNASRLTPSEVSGIASAIDVPVYILGIVPSIDNPTSDLAGGLSVSESRWSSLRDLAYWTGGNLFFASSPAERNVVARQVIDELRHQYFIAFEAAANPGWRPLVVRTRDRKLEVRARSGYFAGLSRPIS
ncbi:MAG: VWA domain-containing protein [Vicinamibacterales bacterium]